MRGGRPSADRAEFLGWALDLRPVDKSNWPGARRSARLGISNAAGSRIARLTAALHQAGASRAKDLAAADRAKR